MKDEATIDAQGKTLPIAECPICHYQFDAATCLNDESRPNPGDFSLCLKCGELLVFREGMIVEQANVDDVLKLLPETDALLRRAQALIRNKRFLS